MSLRLWKIAQQRQGEEHRVLGHRLGVAAGGRHICDEDSFASGSVDVHSLKTGTPLLHQVKRSSLDCLGSNPLHLRDDDIDAGKVRHDVSVRADDDLVIGAWIKMSAQIFRRVGERISAEKNTHYATSSARASLPALAVSAP